MLLSGVHVTPAPLILTIFFFFSGIRLDMLRRE